MMIKIVRMMMTVFPEIIVTIMMMRWRGKRMVKMIKIVMMTVFPKIILAMMMMRRRRKKVIMMIKIVMMMMAVFPEIIVAYNVLTPLPEISHQSRSLYFKILRILYFILRSSHQKVLMRRNKISTLSENHHHQHFLQEREVLHLL